MVFQSTKTTTTTTNKIIYRIIMKSANHYFSFFFVRKIRLMYPFVSIRSSLMLETTPFEENVRPFAPTFPRNSPPRLALTMNLHFTCRRRSSSLSFTSSFLKHVALSEIIKFGTPLRPMNRFKLLINAEADKSGTMSK